jgi:hypothetical protein
MSWFPSVMMRAGGEIILDLRHPFLGGAETESSPKATAPINRAELILQLFYALAREFEIRGTLFASYD